MTAQPDDVARLLRDWRDGDASALDRLMPLVYDELRRLAARQMRRERVNHTLQPTALVNEAYVQLLGQRRASWENRAHFFGAAAAVMRRLLVDHARRKRADKRGGGALNVSLRDAAGAADRGSEVDMVALDEALSELAALDPPLARLVEMRYFGGLSVEEAAGVLGCSPATVKRHWKTARIWLRRRLAGVQA